MRERLNAWLSSQRVPPPDSSVLLTALDEFLEREGFPKESKKKK